MTLLPRKTGNDPLTQITSLNIASRQNKLLIAGVLLLLYSSCEQKPATSQRGIQQIPSVNIASPSTPARSDTLEFLRLQAEEGLMDAQYIYAYHLMIHQEQPSDLVLAQDWFTKSAQQGHIEACYRLGNLLALGTVDGNPNISAATHWLLKAANDGHSGAQYLLGQYCIHGEGVVQNPEKALEWLRLAAEQNHPSAQYLLARMFETGQGTPPNLHSAFQWYEKAAKAGHPAAQYKTAEMTHNGMGTVPNPEVAQKWYAQAHAFGLPIPSKENAVPPRPVHSSPPPASISVDTYAYSEAGPQGPEGSQPKIGSRDIPPEPFEESKADEATSPNVAQSPVPQKRIKKIIPEEGPDAKEEKVFLEQTQPSVEFQSEIQKKENSPAELEYKIAENYASGGALPADPAKAKLFYEHSADQGHPQALHKLAMGHLNPPASGTPDVKKAIHYLEQAASKGYPPSQHQLAEIHYTGMLGEPNYSQAFLWYRLAANNENPDAQYRLGNMYYEGEGVEQNLENAKKWLHLAASHNNQPAVNLLHVIHEAAQKAQQTDTSSATTEISDSNQPAKPAKEALEIPVEPSLAVPVQPASPATTQLTPQDWMEKGLRLYNSQNQPTAESYREAYQCFVRAANGKIGDAWYYIGRMYDYGEGLTANPEKAYQSYLVAAREGNARAQYSLGFMYETGYGCQKLPTEAYVWYAIAAGNGLSNARQTQLGLENKMTSTELEFARNRLRTLQGYLNNYIEQKSVRHLPFE